MKCALKIWNAVELACFLKADLNSVVADVEAISSDDCETRQRWKRKSKSSTSGEKLKSAKTPIAEPESQASGLHNDTDNSLFLFRVKSSGVRQSKIYKSLLGITGLKEIFFNPLVP